MKLLIFIGLKLAEILGVCGCIGILYGLGLVMTYVIGFKPEDTRWGHILAKGFISLGGLFLIFIISLGIYHAIKANWAWATRLSKK